METKNIQEEWKYKKVRTAKGMLRLINDLKPKEFEVFNTARTFLGLFSRCYSIIYFGRGLGDGNYKLKKCGRIKSLTTFLNNTNVSKKVVFTNTRCFIPFASLYMTIYN